MPHPIVHIEFSALDLGQMSNFYSGVFGWKTKDYPDMKYTEFYPGEGVEGGFNLAGENYPAGTVLVYIQTDDIEGTLSTIEKHGGKTVTPKYEIAELGWIATFNDPTGNLVGLFKPFRKL